MKFQNHPITKILDNGIFFKIAPNEPKICGSIKTGKMIVEGKSLYNSDIDFIKKDLICINYLAPTLLIKLFSSE